MSHSPKRHYLAIDQGGHASRALLFNEVGDLIAQASQAINTLHPQAGYVEHEPLALLESIHLAMRDCLAQANGLTVRAAGLATQRSSLVCWDKNSGNALSNVISWQDRRAAAWMARYQTQQEWIHNRTGLYPSPHYGASKIRWCLEHLPHVAEAANRGSLIIGSLASYLIDQLCQEHPALVDPANGSRTLLLNLATRDWDDELLRLFNINRAILPHCVPNQFAFGTLEHALPLRIVTGDQSAAVFFNGQPDANTAYINIGTGAFVQRISTTPQPHCQPLLASVVYCDSHESYYALEGTINGGGSAVSWFEDHHLHNNDWQANFDTWLQQPSDELYFINTVGGLATPYWRSDIDPHFIGAGSVAEQFSAIIESILFLILRNLEEMHRHLAPAKALMISGGFSRSDALCQHLANLTGLLVQRPDEKEATARGLAFLLCENQPLWQTSALTHFHPRHDENLNQRYRNWLGLIDKIIVN